MLCICYDTNSSQERYPLPGNVVYFYKDKYVRSGVLYTKKNKMPTTQAGTFSHVARPHALRNITYMFTLNLLRRNCARFITIRSRYYINCAQYMYTVTQVSCTLLQLQSLCTSCMYLSLLTVVIIPTVAHNKNICKS